MEQQPQRPARSRKTRRSVRIADRVARALISVGGIGTIFAVSLVCVFLVAVVVPLFGGTAIRTVAAVEHAEDSNSARPLHLAINEYLSLGWELFDDGSLAAFRVDTGKRLEKQQIVEPGSELTAWAFSPSGDDVVLGFADGTIRYGRIDFRTQFIEPGDEPAELAGIKPGEIVELDGGVVDLAQTGQLRRQSVRVELKDPIELAAAGESASGQAMRLVDLSMRPTGPIIAAYTEDGRLLFKQVSSRRNLMTGKTTTTLTGGEMHVPRQEGRGAPSALLLSGVGDTAYLAWEDGYVARFDTRVVSAPALAETVDLVPEPGEKLTALRFMTGKTSLVAGDSLGRVRTWFRTKPEHARTPDGSVLVQSHDLSAGAGRRAAADSPVTSLAASPRSRMIAAGYADGSVRLFQVTAERLLGVGEAAAGRAITALALAPNDRALLAATGGGVGGLHLWRVDAPHPETTPHTIFGKVWYEGSEGPEHVWQSSSGTDEFEPKFGLMPLIFGTLKATVYSMLFGVPLALLAAVYTSEFLHARTRARVKPAIEMMASLPSVVLGFLAALVIAPFVADVVPEVLAMFVTVPFVFLLGAHLWQLLPSQLGIRLSRHRFPLLVALVPVGIGLGFLLGPVAESVLFAGDIKAWLDGQIGSGAGAWFILLLPAMALATTAVINWGVRPRLRSVTGSWSHAQAGRFELAMFLGTVLATLVGAFVLSYLLAAVAWDPRGSYVSTYVQRNALVVGFVMGFAIIPIIYTISEDALSAVPEHLRSASLGAGATPWQTAMRVIVPTAMSGLFSAVMIGFGRAVGETMIVLMAAGNTPLMEWNIFNGFRTLSANIAVELPEAVRGDTHYRMLFLAALSLFAITFAVNTMAEVVRQRFRRRAFQL